MTSLAPNGHVIPLVDLQAAHSEVADEMSSGFRQDLDGGAFIKRRDVAEFEREFASFSGAAHCVAVANGPDAIELALLAADQQQQLVVDRLRQAHGSMRVVSCQS